MATETAPQTDLLVAEIPYLRRYARALTRNAAAADDLVQDALVRGIVSFAQFQPGTNLRAWLLTIVHHCFIDGTRKASRARLGNQAAEERMSGFYTRPNQLANLELSDLQAALNSLPEEQRTTLVLVALEDMSYDEAAQVTGVPVGTIRSRLSRARHSLMEKIAGLEIGDISPESGITRRKKPVALVARPKRPAGEPTKLFQRVS
jgi:RNA polymerase sigma-70 factor (ECF subfamily)